jgi:hypothetical protein
MEKTPTEELICEVCDEIKHMLLEKNRKYGNSALEPKRIFAKSDTIEQLNVRIDDKLSRIANRQNDEDEDVFRDLIGYLVLKLVKNKQMSKEWYDVPPKCPDMKAWYLDRNGEWKIMPDQTPSDIHFDK